MQTLTYNRYKANMVFEAADDVFVGYVLGVADSVSFEADDVAGLKASFKDAFELLRKDKARP